MSCGIIIRQSGFCVAKYGGSMVITQSNRVTVTFSMFSVYFSFMPFIRLHNWSTENQTAMSRTTVNIGTKCGKPRKIKDCWCTIILEY